MAERDRRKDRYKDVTEIRDFDGMSPGLDPVDTGPGTSRIQVNVVATHPGELRVRGGMKLVRFEE